jgi:hypothetical protein
MTLQVGSKVFVPHKVRVTLNGESHEYSPAVREGIVKDIDDNRVVVTIETEIGSPEDHEFHDLGTICDYPPGYHLIPITK